MFKHFSKHRLVALWTAVAAVVLAPGCESFLDEEPRSAVQTEGSINNAQTAEAAALSLYNALSSANLYNANFILYGELAGTNTLWFGSFTQPSDILNRAVLANNGFITATYQSAYTTINQANFLIREFSRPIPSVDASTRDRYRGEAYATRGMLYFELVRWFASPWGTTPDNSHLGVPIVTDVVDNFSQAQQFPRRASVADVYARAIADLDSAIALLPVTPGEVGGPGVRFNSLFAQAFKARVLLQRARVVGATDWQQIANLTQNVIDSDEYALNATVAGSFLTKNSPESLFEIQNTAVDNPGTNASITAFATPRFQDGRSGRGDFGLRAAALNVLTTAQTPGGVNIYGPLFSNNVSPRADGITSYTYESLSDARIGLFIPGSGNRLFTTKYFRDATLDDNVIVMRYAEVLLMNAEANNELGNTSLALDRLNEVRNRANLPDYPFATDQATLRSHIFRERRLEFVFEGHHYQDLIRNAEVASIRSVSKTASSAIFPIPQIEVDRNPNLVQNPGY